ncbi:MAG: hypothetical protein ACI4MJ_06810, partial [Aristaeellaceae bacterium]
MLFMLRSSKEHGDCISRDGLTISQAEGDTRFVTRLACLVLAAMFGLDIIPFDEVLRSQEMFYSSDGISVSWLATFRDGDPTDAAFRTRLIDAFINAVYVYED